MAVSGRFGLRPIPEAEFSAANYFCDAGQRLPKTALKQRDGQTEPKEQEKEMMIRPPVRSFDPPCV